MSLLRYGMFLTLIVWLGELIFFAFVLAPTVFSVLPTRHLAGNVVSRSLSALHWIGIISGVVFLVCSMVYARLHSGSAHRFAVRHILVYIMLGLTAISQFAIIPKMTALRTSMGVIDEVALTAPSRIQFDALHVWSTRLESGVFLLGLVVAYLTAQIIASPA